jgi:hypothetical protein
MPQAAPGVEIDGADKQKLICEARQWVDSLQLPGVRPSTSRAYKHLLHTMCDWIRCRKEGGWIADPSLSKWAAAAGVDRSTVTRQLIKIVELKVLKRYASGGVNGDTTSYWMGAPTLGAKCTYVQNAPRGKLHPNTRNKSVSLSTGVHSLTSSSHQHAADDDVKDPPPKADPPETRRAYAETLRRTFNTLPTARRRRSLSPDDRQLAFEWYARGLPAKVVEIALWLGVGRRIKEPGVAPPPVNSLSYFADVVEEIAPVVPRLTQQLDVYAHLTKQSTLRRLKPLERFAPATAGDAQRLGFSSYGAFVQELMDQGLSPPEGWEELGEDSS